MPHGTRINGTSYGITGGRCLVNGTAYSIKKGRTLVNGTGYDISFGKTLGSCEESDTVKINESGKPVEFYVAKHDYESILNGTGRTLVVRKDCYDNRQWNTSNINAYASSTIDGWLNSTYKNVLDPNIRSLVSTTKIKYTPGNGNYNIDTLERSIFLLSLTELGFSYEYANIEGNVLPISDYLKISYFNGIANNQLTRTPSKASNSSILIVNKSGISSVDGCIWENGSRPAFTLPSSVVVGETGLIA